MTSCCCCFSQPATEIKSSRKGSIDRRMVHRSPPQYSPRCTKPGWLTDVLSDKSSCWTVRGRGERLTSVRHAARDGPFACRWVIQLGARDWIVGNIHSPGHQHFSVLQKGGGVVIPRGDEAAG